MSTEPTLLTRLAALVTALFLIPASCCRELRATPPAPVVILILMHLAIPVITNTELNKVRRSVGGPR